MDARFRGHDGRWRAGTYVAAYGKKSVGRPDAAASGDHEERGPETEVVTADRTRAEVMDELLPPVET
jgi:hypothetical protein